MWSVMSPPFRWESTTGCELFWRRGGSLDERPRAKYSQVIARVEPGNRIEPKVTQLFEKSFAGMMNVLACVLANDLYLPLGGG
jgi:hypothetical protein